MAWVLCSRPALTAVGDVLWLIRAVTPFLCSKQWCEGGRYVCCDAREVMGVTQITELARQPRAAVLSINVDVGLKCGRSYLHRIEFSQAGSWTVSLQRGSWITGCVYSISSLVPLKGLGFFLLILGEQQLYRYLGLYYLLEILPSFLPVVSTKTMN